jgi:exonuclease VII small subunit
MMQVSEIRQRLDNVERNLQQASQAFSNGMKVPSELKNCVQQLNQQTSQARQDIQSQNQTRIVQCVDQLEQLSDRAKKEVERSNSIDGQIRTAILQAHSELSNLKHQLH